MAALAATLASLAAVAEQDTALEFESAWVRALPPFQPNTAAYLTLVNRGDVAIASYAPTRESKDCDPNPAHCMETVRCG